MNLDNNVYLHFKFTDVPLKNRPLTGIIWPDMEKKSIIINSVFAVSIIALFVLHFTDKSNKSASLLVPTSDSTAVYVKLPIAYVNIDTLLQNYNFSKDMNETLLRKQENARATLSQKARQFETEMAEFQKKYENNAFLSEQSFKNQQQRLQKKQADLQKLEESLTQQLLEDQQDMNLQLKESIYAFLARYNKDKKYQLILSNTMNDNIMLSDPDYNITNEVVEALNKEYTPKEDWPVCFTTYWKAGHCFCLFLASMTMRQPNAPFCHVLPAGMTIEKQQV